MSEWPAGADFDRFMAEHGPAFVRLATLLCGDAQEGEDAVQEAFISLGRAWTRVRPATAVAYARAAVARKSMDVIRRRPPAQYGEVPEIAVADDGMLRFEGDRAFFARLAGLPKQQRAVLVLRYYADVEDKEIARMLGCTVSTVRSQAHRALARLRQEQSMSTEGGAS